MKNFWIERSEDRRQIELTTHMMMLFNLGCITARQAMKLEDFRPKEQNEKPLD